MKAVWVLIAGLSGAAAVIAGAAGSHLLEDHPGRVQLLRTGSDYALWHAAALIALAALAGRGEVLSGRLLALAGWLFVVGLVLFPPSLYLVAATGERGFAWATPFGGTALILGWIALALEALASLRRARR